VDLLKSGLWYSTSKQKATMDDPQETVPPA
jgi:hypothetical protein